MNTKYDVGQTVLLKATVKAISSEKVGVVNYCLDVKSDNGLFCGDVSLNVEENQIICGWIGGDDECV